MLLVDFLFVEVVACCFEVRVSIKREDGFVARGLFGVCWGLLFVERCWMYLNNLLLFGVFEWMYLLCEFIELDSGFAFSGLERSIRERFEVGVVGVVGMILSVIVCWCVVSGCGVCVCVFVIFFMECVFLCCGDGFK